MEVELELEVMMVEVAEEVVQRLRSAGRRQGVINRELGPTCVFSRKASRSCRSAGRSAAASAISPSSQRPRREPRGAATSSRSKPLATGCAARSAAARSRRQARSCAELEVEGGGVDEATG